MSENKHERESLVADQLKTTIDKLIEKHKDKLSSITREHEQALVMDAPATFNDCPTATRLILKRPTPGEEDEAKAKWNYYGGYRVSVFEADGQLQTDFMVAHDDILRRQVIATPGSFEPLSNETEDDFHDRRSSELLGDALSLVVLDGMQRAAEVRRRNLGEPTAPEIASELISWIQSAEPANIKN